MAESNGAFDCTEFDAGIRMAMHDWETTVVTEPCPDTVERITYTFLSEG